MHFSIKTHNILTFLCGFITAVIGLTVIIGWHLNSPALIQVRPGFAPMQYNTALGFVLAGVMVLTLTLKRQNFTMLLASGLLVLGSLTLFEYVTGTNLGIDEFFMDAYLMDRTTHPGRMAPITALCFTLTGLAVALSHRYHKALISLSASIIFLSSLSIIGYLIDVQGVYGWGNLTRMAIHTATCFLILGAGLVVLAFKQASREDTDNWNNLPPALSGIVLIVSLMSSFAINEVTHVRHTEYFDRLVSDTHDALLRRYNLYEHSLVGGVGMFYASKTVQRDEWNIYIQALDIETTLPGIAGIGYIASVQAEDLSEYLQSAVLDGAPNFVNHPETLHNDKFIITYIEPESFNAKAIGLDIGFESNRRDAAEFARDNGVPALTRKIILVQDGTQTPGFLLLVPVYDTKSIPDTVAARRNHIRGWVYAPFIARDFMVGLTRVNQDQVSFEVYDGNHVTKDALIYSSNLTRNTYDSYAVQTELDFDGRTWTINWHTTDKFMPPSDQNLPLIILLFGSVCSVLIYFTIFRLLRSKNIISQEVEKQTRKLVSSEKRLQLVFDSAGEGIYGLDLNGHTTFANKAAEDLLGYKLEDMADTYLPDLIADVSIEDAPYHEREHSFVSAISDGQSHTISSEFFRHKTGVKIPVEYTSKPIINDENEISGAVVVFRDIADRKIAEAEIKEANAELEEFAYRTSHDLRSPLVSSISLLNIAQKAIHSDNKGTALASLTHTQKSLRKLEELVRDILVLTQAKNQEEQASDINIETVINDALDKLKFMDNFQRLNIEYDLNFSGTLTTMRNRVVLIVENLISNAVKYQDLKKSTPYLKLSTYQSGHNFVLMAQDNGIGVPKNQQKNLFEMFRRFHPKTSFGSGLGLYMMKKSVSILGGHIYFEDPGEGTIFKIEIPLSEKDNTNYKIMAKLNKE